MGCARRVPRGTTLIVSWPPYFHSPAVSELLTKSPTERVVHGTFILLWLLLLAYGARQWVTDDPEAFKPRRFTVVTAAILLQPFSAILHERHRAVKWSLLVLSLAGMGLSWRMAS